MPSPNSSPSRIWLPFCRKYSSIEWSPIGCPTGCVALCYDKTLPGMRLFLQIIRICIMVRPSAGGARMRNIGLAFIVAGSLLAGMPSVHAAGDLSKQEPIEVVVELGKPGHHAFIPNKLRFETGKLY